jgi:hypothetical protein
VTAGGGSCMLDDVSAFSGQRGMGRSIGFDGWMDGWPCAGCAGL